MAESANAIGSHNKMHSATLTFLVSTKGMQLNPYVHILLQRVMTLRHMLMKWTYVREVFQDILDSYVNIAYAGLYVGDE